MAENREQLARRLNEDGFKPGAVVKHKESGQVHTVARIRKGRVYENNDGTGMIGFVHAFKVVTPNHNADAEYWGKIDNCKRWGSRRY